MKKPILLLMVTMLLSSCLHYYYVPNTHNVPLFKEKNEARIAGSLAIGTESVSYEVQGAYSVTDNIALALSAMSTEGLDNEEHDYAKGMYIDAAMGYYHPISNWMVVELFGGFGIGMQEHEYSDNYEYKAGWAHLSNSKIYLQPAYGITLYDCFDVSVSARLGMLNYYNVSYDTENTYESIDLGKLDDRLHFLIEPAITVRGGWKYFKVQTQVSLVESWDEEYLEMAEFIHVSAGLYISLGNRFNRK